MDNFQTFYRAQNPMNGGSITKPTPRKSLTMSMGNKHQNIIQKDRKVIGQREHPDVEQFIKMNLQKKDITNTINDIVKLYGLGVINPGEERSINSNSPVKIRNENGRYFLTR
jgi:hypothetical protein